MSDEQTNERPSTIQAERNGIAVRALVYHDAMVKINRGQDGTRYVSIYGKGSSVELKILPDLWEKLVKA